MMSPEKLYPLSPVLWQYFRHCWECVWYHSVCKFNEDVFLNYLSVLFTMTTNVQLPIRKYLSFCMYKKTETTSFMLFPYSLSSSDNAISHPCLLSSLWRQHGMNCHHVKFGEARRPLYVWTFDVIGHGTQYSLEL